MLQRRRCGRVQKYSDSGVASESQMSGSFETPSLQVTTAPHYYGHGTPFSCLSIHLQTERCDGTTTVPDLKLREAIRKQMPWSGGGVLVGHY